MEQKTLWMDTTPKPICFSKWQDVVDILIIGAGITGLTTAYFLKDEKEKIAILEKQEIGMGATGRTTGKLTYLQGDIYQKLIKMWNKDKAHLYLLSQKEAIDIVSNIIRKEKIDCDCHTVPSYLLMRNHAEEKVLQFTQQFLEEFQISCQTQHIELEIPNQGALQVPDTLVFHPLKYLYGLASILTTKKIPILEHITAQAIIKDQNSYQVITDHGEIRAKKVVLATHYPFPILPGATPLRSHVECSYIVASPIDNPKEISAITTKGDVHSLRYTYQNPHLLYASEDHKITEQLDSKKHFQRVEEHLKEWFQKESSYRWKNEDICTNDFLPLMGPIKEDLYGATGFQKWGMTNGTIAGKIMSDQLKGIQNPYASLFSWQRQLQLGAVKNTMIDYFAYGKIYLETSIIKNHNFYNQAYIVYENFTPYGIYIDSKGQQHKVKNKCPHMKCNLIWNEVEHTWDCPCHGSRFQVDGSVLEGPATASIQIDKN